MKRSSVPIPDEKKDQSDQNQENPPHDQVEQTPPDDQAQEQSAAADD